MGVPRTGFPRALRRLYDYMDGLITPTDGDVPIGAIPSVTGLTVSEEGVSTFRRTTLTFTNMAIALTDNPGVIAFGGQKVYDFPAGNILVLGATLDVVLTKSSVGVNADADGDVGVGTATAGNNNALAGTEQDVIPTTSTPQMVAGVSAVKANNAAAIAPIIAGLTTDVDLFLNFIIDDTDHNVAATPCNLIVNGTLVVTWVQLGNH